MVSQQPGYRPGRRYALMGSVVDALLSLQRKNLLLYVHTDEHNQHRKLFYLVKTVPSISET